MPWVLGFSAVRHMPSMEVPISNISELRDGVSQLMQRREGAAILYVLGNDRECLSFGVEGHLAYVTHIPPRESDTPVLWASTGQFSGEDFVEFNVGDTPTEILLRLCIPAERLLSVLEHFFRQ